MKKENKFEIEIVPKQCNKNKKSNNIQPIKEIVKLQYDTISLIQDEKITKDNFDTIEKLSLSTEDVIRNCMTDSEYSGNRDENFVNLTFLCHKLLLRIETYKIEEKIRELDKKSNEIDKKSKQLEKKQENLEEQSNNLIYNILSFIVSFSIVSAAVEAIANIKGTLNIILFMTFCVFLVITTLIGMNNFSKSNKKEKGLNNNYFLWKLLFFIIIILGIICGVKYIKNNPEQYKNLINLKIEYNNSNS